MLSAILLAAGASRRMGPENKLLLPLGETTVLETTLTQLENAAIGEILVITGFETERIQLLLTGRHCRIVENPDFETGMTSSIKTGIRNASHHSTGYLICLADMPLISAPEYRLLADFFEKVQVTDPAAIIQPRYAGQRGNPVFLSAAYREELLNLDYPEGAKPVLQANLQHVYLLDMPTDAVLLDADTPEAYQILLKRFETGFI